MKILKLLEQRIEKVGKHLNKEKQIMDINKGKEKMVMERDEQRTIYKGRPGSSSRNAAITKSEKPKSRLKHLAPTTPKTGSTCTTLVVPTKRPPPVTNCVLGLAAVTTWQQILNKEFGIKRSKEDVGGSSDVRRKGEYDMWKLRIKQYFQVQDYALWDVIENGNSFKPAAQTTTDVDGSSTTLIPGPYKDAKTLFAAIQKRFGGNDATKKTRKTLLKQMYENFSAPSTESLDSIFNRLQKIIVEQEVKGTASSSSQNLAFMSSTSSTNEVNTAYGVSTANTQASTPSTQVSTANLSDDTMKKSLQTWLLWLFQTLRIEFNKSEFNLATYKRGLSSVEEQLIFYKKNVVLFCEQLVVLKRDISYKDLEIRTLKSKLDKLKQDKESNQLKIEKINNASKSLDKLIGSQIPDKSRKEEFQQPKFEGYGPKISNSVSKDISNEVMKSPDAPLVEELVSNDKLEKKTVFLIVAKINFVKQQQQEKPVRKPVKYAKIFDHMQANCNYHQRERMVSGNNYTRVNHNYVAQKAHTNTKRNMAPRAVLMKTGLRPLNSARPVNTAHPKTTVYSARPMPKAVNIARPNTTLVNAVNANQGHPQIEDQGYVDSGCSRHMTGNMSYLSYFKAFDGGYVTFKEGAKGEIITSKGTLKTHKLDFEDVLLKVPRKNNMYSVNMKNIVPKECLTCLVAKATLDESILWHRRLGHVNFKTINKLVKDNLVRGFPSKRFENDQTCVACLKGKQHKASCKFDGKSNDGFFIGYSLNRKAFRVYNIRTRKVKESLHVRFLEDKPIVAGDGPKWLFDIDVITESMNYVSVVAGTNSNDFVDTQESIGAGQSNKETGSSQDYILMLLWKDGSLFDSSSKNANNDEPQPSNDAGKKDDEGGIDNQERPEKSAQDVNTGRPSINTANTNDNTGSLNMNTGSPIVTTAPTETTHADYFEDETEVDMSNISTTYPVPSTPNSRIHKYHSLDNVIGDMQSSIQTRRMTKTINDQGFISDVYEGKTHEDLHTCLFACFLSQEEPKRIAKALSDSAWVEAMQEELLQF
ncbi:ribonuclease H-like domain-containing protein [Tanacetum coccineum]